MLGFFFTTGFGTTFGSGSGAGAGGGGAGAGAAAAATDFAADDAGFLGFCAAGLADGGWGSAAGASVDGSPRSSTATESGAGSTAGAATGSGAFCTTSGALASAPLATGAGVAGPFNERASTKPPMPKTATTATTPANQGTFDELTGKGGVAESAAFVLCEPPYGSPVCPADCNAWMPNPGVRPGSGDSVPEPGCGVWGRNMPGCGV